MQRQHHAARPQLDVPGAGRQRGQQHGRARVRRAERVEVALRHPDGVQAGAVGQLGTLEDQVALLRGAVIVVRGKKEHADLHRVRRGAGAAPLFE